MRLPFLVRTAVIVAGASYSCIAFGQNLSSVTLAVDTIVGGYRTTGTVRLDAVAPSGGTTVALTTDNNSKVQVPADVLVNAGSKVKMFSALTQTVLSDTLVTVTASHNAVDKTDTLLLLPGGLTDLSCDSPLSSGDVGEGQAWLSGITASDVAIELTSSDPAVASVPATTTVPAGDKYSDIFDVTAGAVAVDTYVTIRAKLDVSIRTETIVVRAINMSLSFKVFKSNGVPRNGGLVTVTYSDNSTESQYTNPAGKAVFFNLVPGPATFIEDRPGSKGFFGPYSFTVLKSDPTTVTFTEP